MKYYIYVNYNKLVQAYERPLVRPEDKDEYLELCHRDYLASDDNAKAKIREYDINLVGEFNDTTGKITLYDMPLKVADLQMFGAKPEEKKAEAPVNA